MVARVEILAVGDEILNGDVQDSDTRLLARAIADLGGAVERVSVVRDDVATIAGAVREALARGATLLLTVGGLGPTPDDRTLEGIAQATGRPLRLDASARAFIAERYGALARAGAVRDAEVSAPREKMARLPEGASWLPNAVGAAPAPVLEVGRVVIVALPGPPRELEAIMSELRPILRRALGAAAVARSRYRLGLDDETDFAPIHDRVQPRHPHVYLKSRFHAFAKDHALLVTLQARGHDEQAAHQRLDEAARDLEATLREAGIGFHREQE